MSSKTTYFCDQCNKEFGKSDELTHIKIVLEPYNHYKTKKFTKVCQSYSICDECAIKLGFLLKTKKDNTVSVEPTTAEKLYDIIAEMVRENIE